jgi:hypothetical protein
LLQNETVDDFIRRLEVTERPKRERSAAKRLYWKMFVSNI